MSTVPKVKICGIRRTEDALSAARFGADALGFNFYPKSPRYIEPGEAKKLGEAVPPSVWRVGLFVNEKSDQILKTIEAAGLDSVQLHGDESVEDVMKLGGLRVIKALRLKDSEDLKRALEFADAADFLLVDAYHPEQYGGSGTTIEDSLLDEFGTQDLWSKTFLAGGLTPDNVSDKIAERRPFGVDAASGVERAPGEKSVELLSRFITAAKVQK